MCRNTNICSTVTSIRNQKLRSLCAYMFRKHLSRIEIARNKRISFLCYVSQQKYSGKRKRTKPTSTDTTDWMAVYFCHFRALIDIFALHLNFDISEIDEWFSVFFSLFQLTHTHIPTNSGRFACFMKLFDILQSPNNNNPHEYYQLNRVISDCHQIHQ